VLGKRAEVLVISALILGLIGYASLGLAFAGTRIATAERTVEAVVSHQNTLNATFHTINVQLTALGARTSFDAAQTIALVGQSVANAELASRTVGQDEASLRLADSGLREHPWLTMMSGAALDRTSIHVRHARQALVIARSIAADEVLDGQFWQSLYGGLADLGDLNRHRDAGDLTGARQALAKMSFDVDRAAALASSPGLPPEITVLTGDLNKLVVDYTRQLDAEAAGSYDNAAAISVDVSADMTRIATFDVDGVGAKIEAFYQPQIDRYNQEIDAATT
jgi:hypothetical protein